MQHQALALAVAPVLALAATPAVALAEDLLLPGDTAIAIDEDGFTFGSFPAGEAPANVLDGNSSTKYLNFGGSGSGFIVTPSMASILQSFQLTTANDSESRDPTSFSLFGTNDAISSTDNSQGTLEDWNEIASGMLNLPSARETAGPIVDVTNSTSYSSYKLFFPTLKGGDGFFMQIADAQFFTGTGGSGSAILSASDAIVGIDNTGVPDSDFPDGEAPQFAIDGDTSTKHLNFGEENSGLVLEPSRGASIVTSITLTTANDAEARDPSSFEIYGTNESLVTPQNGTGDEQMWTFIAAGDLDLPADREAEGPTVDFANTTAFTAYKVVFPTVKDADNANSIQYSELQLGGTFVVPEPSSLALLGLGGVTLLRRRR